jgi:hypothetical protein
LNGLVKDVTFFAIATVFGVMDGDMGVCGAG